MYTLLVCCAMACNDDKEDNGEYTKSPLTPDQNKAKIESIGKDFVAKINAEDHEKVVNSLKDLTEAIDGSNFEDLLPEYLQDNEDNDYFYDSYLLKRTIQNNDINALMQLATKAIDEDDEYRVKDFAGIYTYNAQTQAWTKTEVNNKVELRYTMNGTTSVLSTTFDGIKTYNKVDGVIIDVPAKTEMTLTVNDEKVMNLVTNIDLANDLYSAKINCTLTLSDDYSWNVTADINPEKVAASCKMTVKGEDLINGSATVTGTQLTDPDNIETNEENILNNGNFEFTIMNLRLTGNGDIKALVKGMDKIKDMDPWDEDYTEAADKKNAEEEMNLYNDYVKIEGFYVQEKQKFADVKMGLISEERECYVYWDDQQERPIYEKRIDWDIQPILVFTDNSEVAFDSFFTESRFSSLISSVETLINKYMNMIDEEPIEL